MPGISLPSWNPAWSETAWDTSLDEGLRSLRFDVMLSGPETAPDNLALDATLLSRVADGRRPPLLHFWDWSQPAVILGSYQSVSDEVDRVLADESGFAVARRISGGGAMVVEPKKTITWSLIVPEDILKDLSCVQSFAFLDAWCVRALRSIGVPAVYKPVNDVASPSGKIAGAAQCRRRGAVLHHVAMAYDLDQDLMTRLLRHGLPRSNPKGVPSARKRVSPLNLLTDLSREALIDTLMTAFASIFRTRESHILEQERQEAAALAADKFTSDEWLYRVT